MSKKSNFLRKRAVRHVVRVVSRLGLTFLCVLCFRTLKFEANVFDRSIGSTTSPAEVSSNAVFAQEPSLNEKAPNNAKGQIVFFSIPVAVESAPIYAGPDASAYSTGSVAKDRFVEVYFRTENGWCAVRPPQGSFSWVNAKFVRLENDSSGRIVSSNGKAIPARVGFSTVETSAIVQVGLKSNQKIKILEKSTASNGSVWYKIAPPPGEFRWIREESLLADPALQKLPSKLTFQEEFLANLNRRESTDSTLNAPTQEFSPNPLGDGENSVDKLTLPELATADVERSETQPLDENEFKKQVAQLNADVFQTLRNPSPSDAELALLASRAEYLFDAAPNDSERFFVQSIFSAIKIAERQKKEPLSAPTSPETTPGSQFLDAINYDNGNRTTPFPNGDAPLFLPDVSANGFENPNGWNQVAASNGSPTAFAPNDRPTGPISAADAGARKNRLAFAFSNETNPFRSSKSKEVVVFPNPSTPSTGRPTSAKLPPLFPSEKQIIVPPANYRSNIFGQTVRRNAKLVAATEKKKNDAPTAAGSQTTNESKESTQIAQSTQPQQNATDITTQNARWRAVESTSSKNGTSQPIVQTSAQKKASSRSDKMNAEGVKSPKTSTPATKIRQTGDFRPISVAPSSVFDAEGTLAALVETTNATPKFALVRPNGDEFDVVRYLEAGDGVSLDRYVGQKIGVQGVNGTVEIDGKMQKLTIVRSIFPQK